MTTAPDGLEGRARRRAMTAIGLAVLLVALDYSVANVALPAIARDLRIGAGRSIWVVNAYQLASLVALLPVAALGDIVGAARLCRIGLAVFLAASVLCASSGDILSLALARVLQGLGGACVMGVNASLVRAAYPRAAFGRGIALNGLVLAVGVALGPTVSAAVLSVADWPWLFWINLPPGALALALARSGLPRTPRADRRFDAAGAALLVASLLASVLGLDGLAHRGADAPALLPLALGVAGMAALARRESGRAHPLFPVDLLGERGFGLAFAVGFLGFVASNFFLVSMPFLLEGALHRGAVRTGLILTPWAMAVAVGSFAVGRIADRAPVAAVSAAGLAITATGFLLLWRLPHAAGDVGIALRIALAGFGFGVFQPPNNRAMLLSAPPARSGGASGLVSGARLFGQTMGAMSVALVFRIASGPGAPVACLALATAVATAAAGLSWSRRGLARTETASG